MERKIVLLIIALCAPLPSLAADAQNSYMKRVDERSLSIEDLAHSFLLHPAGSSVEEELRQLISPEGVAALGPLIEEYRRESTDIPRLVVKTRKMCGELESARSGAEFAAVFKKVEEQEQADAQRAAKRILASLDPYDRKALEHYLDTEYRCRINIGRLDYDALFKVFPSAHSDGIVRGICLDAAEMERQFAR